MIGGAIVGICVCIIVLILAFTLGVVYALDLPVTVFTAFTLIVACVAVGYFLF